VRQIQDFKETLIIIIIFLVSSSCSNSLDSKNVNYDSLNIQLEKHDTIKIRKPTKSNTAHLFDTLLCKGFDFPVGDNNAKGIYIDLNTKKKYEGWYKAVEFCEEYMYGIHPAEDWNGIGGGNTDLGQAVYSIGKGKVIEAKNAGGNWGNTIAIEHHYYENGAVKKLRSMYMHLDSIMVKKGDFVKRRQQIGTLGNNFGMFHAHLHLELRKESLFEKSITYWPLCDTDSIIKDFEHPTEFIKNHRQILNPIEDSFIVVAVKHEYKLYLIRYGNILDTIPIGLGQEPKGHKTIQGDNKTPEGEYFINEKKLGPFGGTWGDYFGPAWIRISYPNTFDATEGLEKMIISKVEYNAIKKATIKKSLPPKNTDLGGGIGIHGWVEQWDTTQNNDLTWGCISINNDQLLEFYNTVPIYTRILILP